jgi:hypothetical protein
VPPTAVRVVEDPLQIGEVAEAETVGKGFTVSVIDCGAETHPRLSVTVTEYVVVAAGLAVGLATEAELKLAAGAQLYVVYVPEPPLALAVSELELPEQMTAGAAAGATTGN